MNIFNVGTSPKHSPYLNQKIVITNAIASLFAMLSLAFVVFTYIYFLPLLIYPVAFFFTGVCILLSNHYGFHLLSRFMVCVIYSTLYTVYHCALLPAHYHLIGSLYAIQIIFWMTPWLVFDMREQKWLLIYVSYYVISALCLPYLNNLIEIPLPFELVREGALANLILGIAMVAISGSVFIMRYLNYQSEIKNETLLTKVTEQSAFLETRNAQIEAQREVEALTNRRMQNNEEILQKSLKKLKEREEELKQKNIEIEAQREVEVLSNRKLKSNEAILQKSLQKLKERERELKEKTTLLEEQQGEMVSQNEELQQQQEELLSVNETIEATLKELKSTTDRLNKSILYANNIQQVVLPEKEKLASFFTAHFILYLPKDVVSGDFYWFSHLSETQAIFALADCTGHGVPGAFMSMIGNTLLHEIINFNQVTNPAAVLQRLHAATHKVLKQQEGKNSDGMDISVCLFEKQADTTTQLTFAGAKGTAYYTQNQEIKTLQGNRIGIGGFSERVRVFENQTVCLPKETMVYLSTDGFIDQNNNERKRFGSQAFKNLLAEISSFSPFQQKIALSGILKKYQQEEEQRDDISVIGLKM
jgi:serine phosphatase RsbU (regulator of sigma subunit)